MLFAHPESFPAFREKTTALPDVNLARRESFFARRGKSTALPGVDFAHRGSFFARRSKSTALPDADFARRGSFFARRDKSTALLRKKRECVSNDKIQPEIILVILRNPSVLKLLKNKDKWVKSSEVLLSGVSKGDVFICAVSMDFGRFKDIPLSFSIKPQKNPTANKVLQMYVIIFYSVANILTNIL
jgi:hypothetical protein